MRLKAKPFVVKFSPMYIQRLYPIFERLCGPFISQNRDNSTHEAGRRQCLDISTSPIPSCEKIRNASAEVLLQSSVGKTYFGPSL